MADPGSQKATAAAGLAVRLRDIQNQKCFICEQTLDGEVEEFDIDHIKPKAKGGKDEENNLAITHVRCNRSKQDSDLRVARCMGRYDRVKEAMEDLGPNRPNLGDFLKSFQGSTAVARFVLDKQEIVVSGYSKDAPPIRLPLFEDKLSRMKSFFMAFPIDALYHDTRINPRAVGNRVRGLIEEFLAGRPQLELCLAWVSLSGTGSECRINIFDGQHKAVAQMLLGARTLPVRVFVNPDLDVLLETNTAAGTTLRQVAFDRSVQRFLGSQIYAEKVEAFRQARGIPEGDLSFSEKDLLQFFRGEHREVKRYIADEVRSSVIHNAENKLKDFVDFGGKSTEKPVSYSTVEKTFFSLFIHADPLDTPMGYRLEVGDNPRQLEKGQLVRLMSTFAQEVLAGPDKYDFDRGTYRIEEAIRKGEVVPLGHLRAVRMAKEEILHNILRYVRECIKRFFLMQGGGIVEDDELFQQKFPPLLWEHIEKVFRGFAALPLWVDTDSTKSSSVFSGKQTYEFWKEIFNTGKTPSGQAVLAKPLTLESFLGNG